MNAPEEGKVRVAFAELIDLAAEKVGGRALYANDEFFAGKENLLKPGRGVFIPDKYTEFGKWMDGWETRRKRVLPGHDFCILQLGLPGTIRGVNVDTNHFLGNFPEYASVDALEVHDDVTVDTLLGATWTPIIPRTKLVGGTQNYIPVGSEQRWTHLRLNIFPDGGVARFKVHGVVRPDLVKLRAGQRVDLAAAENGGTVVTCNDSFFGPKDNLILPGRAATMGEGWETRRKRVPGFDWIVVKLAVPGHIEHLEVDTNHFKGNFPDMCSLEGCTLTEEVLDFANARDIAWTEVLPKTKLQASHPHHFEGEALRARGPFTHVRLNIFPDGGISRLRVNGRVA
ncbi:allantoicase [Melittangium boletus]|uniref:allantoicase n=1 Tax=Melittangium boletus TaxID=83453 RepID=UPI003DA1D18F